MESQDFGQVVDDDENLQTITFQQSSYQNENPKFDEEDLIENAEDDGMTKDDGDGDDILLSVEDLGGDDDDESNHGAPNSSHNFDENDY